MPDSYTRLAVFYAPPEGSEMARAGARWLGWDAAQGVALPQPELGLDMPGTTSTPRKYGLHGTLKPPMRLTTSADAFLNAVETFAQTQNPVEFGPLRLRTLGSFLAIVPDRQSDALTALAADIVQNLDPFRAPLTETDLARRRTSGLTANQDALLARWGYPYVLDEFRFHITLSGKLDKAMMQDAFRAADAWFAPALAEPHVLSDLAVFGEDAQGMFHIVKRFPLAG